MVCGFNFAMVTGRSSRQAVFASGGISGEADITVRNCAIEGRSLYEYHQQ
jgi:hypothetical protein